MNNIVSAVFVGTAVYSLGQWFVRGVIEPYLELNRLIGKIAYDLDYYGNKMEPRYEEEVRKVFRDDACALRSKLYLVTWLRLFRVRRVEEIAKASALLTGQSNFHLPPDPHQWVSHDTQIKKLLRIRW